MVQEPVEATLRRREMLQGGERLLVAVSGGVDSMTLLDVLTSLAADWDWTLSVAHLDHGMRPDSSDDARFVIDHAESLNLPVFHATVDVPAHIKREGCSPEAGARELRYRFLRHAARDANASTIALGHTLDDRAETFFLNLLRGSAIQGLAGMPPTRSECDLRYVRPLIDCTRDMIEMYAKNHGVPYREDPTNRDPRHERNRIRHELMPLLESFNPSVRGAVGRASDALAELGDYLRGEAESLLERSIVESERGSIVLDAQRLDEAHAAVRRHALRQAIVRAKSDIEGVTTGHIEALVGLLDQARSGRAVTLPDGLAARYQADRLTIEPQAAREKTVSAVSVPLKQDGVTDVEPLGWRFSVDMIDGSHPEPSSRLEARLDASTMDGSLVVRNRRPGDRIRPLGLGGTKKLQDILVDAKIPRHERDTVPLICDDHGVLWATGLCLSERGRVTAHTRRTLRIRAERISNQGDR